MRTSLKHAMLAGASLAFLAISGATLTSSPAQAGPLSVTPKQDVAPAALTENVQMRARGGRVGVRGAGIRYGGVGYRGVRYARGGYYRGGYYRGGYGNAFFPAAALGLFAGALGAATWGGAAWGGSPYYCDPYYYTWNYCGGGGGATTAGIIRHIMAAIIPRTMAADIPSTARAARSIAMSIVRAWSAIAGSRQAVTLSARAPMCAPVTRSAAAVADLSVRAPDRLKAVERALQDVGGGHSVDDLGPLCP